MKKFIKAVSIFCAVAMLAGCGLVSKVEEPKELTKEVAVTVDGTDYSSQIFNYYFYNAQGETLVGAGFQDAASVPKDFWTQKNGEKTNLETAKDRAVEVLTENAVVYKKAVEMGLTLSEEDKNAIKSTMEQLTASAEDLKFLKETVGTSPEEYEKFLNEIYLAQKVLPELINKGEIKVDSDEITAQFRSEYVKAKHILITTVDPQTNAPLCEEEVAAAKVKAQDILDQINAGADFDELMNANSEDPGLASAPDGYVFTKGEMVAEFETAAYALKENEVSGLVETSYGIHILKRVPFDMTASQESQILDSKEYEAASPQFEELLNKWKSEAKVKKNDKFLKNVKEYELKAFFGEQ